MSVDNGFTIEIYGFMHSLRTFGTCRQARMPSRNGVEIKVEDSEDRRRSERVQMSGRQLLLNKRMKDDKITMTTNDLRVTTGVIYFAR